MIPVANPKAQYFHYKEEIDRAIQDVLERGWYILGEQVGAFEKEFAAFVGVQYGIGVGSGTEALHLALKACGVGPGDEVITVSHTAVATVAAIHLTGATAVFSDMDARTFTMDPESFLSCFTGKTKAVVPVHIYGHPASMDEILEIAHNRGIQVIEDCAQAHGAYYKGKRVGALGDISCFSFYPTKNLGAIGDGGMIVTNNEEMAHKVRLLREYGWQERYVSEVPGWNSRLDEIQAAVLRVKLRHLDRDNAARVRIAQWYKDGLDGAGPVLPETKENCRHVYHLYVIRSQSRDRLSEFLRRQGIGTAIHYPVPVHLQQAYRMKDVPLPQTERAAKEILSLPMYPELTREEVFFVAEQVRAFIDS